jgi:hypothetical protein
MKEDYLDDFMIVSKNAQPIMDELEAIYVIKSIGPPDYYLGNDYKKDRKGRWQIGQKKYLKEALSRVETMFGILKKYSLPMPSGDHPEMDTQVPDACWHAELDHHDRSIRYRPDDVVSFKILFVCSTRTSG